MRAIGSHETAPSAKTILDRFLHHAEVITITGKTLRPTVSGARRPTVQLGGQLLASWQRRRPA